MILNYLLFLVLVNSAIVLSKYCIFSSFISSLAPEIAHIFIHGPELSPEEIQRCLEYADVYAFGVLVSEILTGYYEVKAYKDDKSVAISKYSVLIFIILHFILIS